jgi:type I restriction enzyme S subunit
MNLPYLITGHDIKNDQLDWNKCYHIEIERYNESPEIMLKLDDLLFTKDGTIGKTLLIDKLPGLSTINSHLLLIRPLNKRYKSKFLQYIFKSSYFNSYVDLTKTGTTFYGVSQETMMEFGGYFPPLTEQEHIVSYLDDKTTKIDELIQKKLRKIDLLKEYRTSLINTVVTKGLNPNVPMKDSGIEWIGEIPVSWNSGKMKYLLSNNDGGVWGTDIEDEEKGTLVVRSTEITIDGNWDLSQILKRYLTESEVIKCKLFEGDIVITKSSGSPQHIGKSVIVSKEIEELNCCYSNFVQRIRFRNYNSKLYHYILNSDIVRSQFKYLTTSSTGLGNLNETSLNDILLPFIPLQEQEHIVSYLDEKTSQIDKTIDIEKKKIELLKEYRQSLISNVVTGKIKVIE